MRFFGRDRSEGSTEVRNSSSAASRESGSAPSPCPFGKNTVRLTAPLRHSSIASGSRTISMWARYCSSLISG